VRDEWNRLTLSAIGRHKSNYRPQGNARAIDTKELTRAAAQAELASTPTLRSRARLERAVRLSDDLSRQIAS
jgi:hypothetical protein